jgi:hypothetical protein
MSLVSRQSLSRSARSLLSEADEKKTTLTVDIGDRRTSLWFR